MRTCGGVARGDERLEPFGTGIRQDDTAMTVTTTSNPFTPRPDETERRARLTRMKRVATGLLALSGGVFVVTAWLEGRYPWLGYVRAMAEASLVGGLADWFAVTALFRYPLGLPIPHTAIVAKQKERIGRILGTFVQNHFLSQDVIATRLLAIRPSERGARWLREPANARTLARQASAGIVRTLEAMPDDRMRAFVHETLTTSLRRTAAAPVLGKTLAVVVAGNGHQALVRRTVELAAQAVQDHHDLIRDKVRLESPWWVPGAVDERIYRKIISAVENLLREIAARPDHPVRASLDNWKSSASGCPTASGASSPVMADAARLNDTICARSSAVATPRTSVSGAASTSALAPRLPARNWRCRWLVWCSAFPICNSPRCPCTSRTSSSGACKAFGCRADLPDFFHESATWTSSRSWAEGVGRRGRCGRRAVPRCGEGVRSSRRCQA
mgnify:CR=1 FL=1